MTAKPKAVRKFTGHECEQPPRALKKIIDTEMQGENNLRNERKKPYSIQCHSPVQIVKIL